ncbi:MAG: molybdopterin converting factor subunit 1 [Labilithrix sp.]|nr:molybdopterin converting factor subunit 1 [Labilithrix sp.]
MNVQVLYFAAVRDLVGKAEERLELPADVDTIDALAIYLCRIHASLEGRLRSVRFARNEELARGDDRLADGDVIALIPPVAGG